jgi:hypothetical protein
MHNTNPCQSAGADKLQASAHHLALQNALVGGLTQWVTDLVQSTIKSAIQKKKADMQKSDAKLVKPSVGCVLCIRSAPASPHSEPGMSSECPTAASRPHSRAG